MIVTLGSGLLNPKGLALDGTGNIFVADEGHNAVKEILAAGGYTTINTLGSGFSGPKSVAVDASGNVFVADEGNEAVKEILAVNGSIPASPTIRTLGSGFGSAIGGPYGLAVDASGNVFVDDRGFNPGFMAIKEMMAVNGSIPASPTINLLGGGFDQPQGVAVDGSDNVFVADTDDGLVWEILAAGGYTTEKPLGGNYWGPNSVAVDGNGNVFVADFGSFDPEDGTHNVEEIQTAGASFAPVNVGASNTNPMQLSSLPLIQKGPVGSRAVLTQGARGLDFTGASGGPCDPDNHGRTCTIYVTFKPKHPGTRYGAAEVLKTSTGEVLASAYIQGTGVGPCRPPLPTPPRAFTLPSKQTTLSSVFRWPIGVAADSRGDVFVADTQHWAVKEIVAVNGSIPASPTIKTLGSQLIFPWTVSVDGAGNVFVGNDLTSIGEGGAVYEIVAAGGYTVVNTLHSGFKGPAAVAVDGSGNLFVAEHADNGGVLEMVAADGYTTVKTLGSGFRYPSGVAVDGSNNVFVSDGGNHAVKEILAAGGYTTVKSLGSGSLDPSGLAVDASGNVFFAGGGDKAVYEILAAGGYTTIITLGSGFNSPSGVALDGSGNIFVSDYNNNSAIKLDYADPPSLTFTGTSGGVESSDSPQTVTVFNDGNADLSFPVPATGGNPTIASGFTLDAATTCPELNSGSTAGTLAAGTNCTYVVDFIPVAAGADSGALMVTDDSLNASPAVTQTIPLAGASTGPYLEFNTPPPAKLAVDHSPGTVAVSLVNASNKVMTTSSGTVTLSVTGPNSYSKVYTATASSGIATFSSLASLSITGSYSYTATDIADGLTQAVAAESVAALPPVGSLAKVVDDSVTYSTTVGQSDSVNISGWVADPEDGSPMSNVKVYIDGTSIGTPTIGIARPAVAAAQHDDAYVLSGYQLLYPVSSLSPGKHHVTVVAIDSFGVSSTLGPSTFTVAATAGSSPPLGVLNQAVDSVTLSTTVSQSDSVNISGWVVDPQDGVPMENVTVYIDSISVGTPRLGIARSGVAKDYGSSYLNSGYQLLYPASSLSLGTHNVTVIASDSGGRSTTFGPVTFTVAAAAGPGSPFGTLNSAVDSVTLSTTVSQSDSVNISGWVFDPGNGVAMSSVTVYIDGTSIGTPTLGLARPGVAKTYGSSYRNSGFQMLYPASSLSVGAHTTKVVAIDSGGRSITLGPVAFTVQ